MVRRRAAQLRDDQALRAVVERRVGARLALRGVVERRAGVRRALRAALEWKGLRAARALVARQEAAERRPPEWALRGQA